MRFFTLLFLQFLFCASLFGQSDSLFIKPQMQEPSRSELISKYRNILLDNIIANDKVKTRENFYYILQQLDDNNYIALYQTEKWMIAYLLNDFHFIISDITNSDSTSMANRKNAVFPGRDQLYMQLSKRLLAQKEIVDSQISSAPDLSNRDKGFVQLILKALVTPNDGHYEQTLNQASTKYLNQYPGSIYDGYVRNVLRYQYIPKGFSLGVEFYSGASILNPALRKGFASGGIFGFGFIWGIDKVQINTRACIVFSSLHTDFPFASTTWATGESAQLFLPEISVSYPIELGKKFVLSPIAGISWFSASPPQDDIDKNSSLKSVEINSQAAPCFGFEIGREFSSYFSPDNYPNKYKRGYYSYHLRYTIQQTRFSSRYDSMNGVIHTIALCIKLGYGGAKRVY
ncbi:hypothetical protein [Paludibacter jiangxiensis]|uniref:Outer membrane protein beta-barrel domain-containing protein n=1 Tax=Paludibacter jiangxiensis TaxID=681398 RepID=A0A171A4L0_9BACT|nr:hypothetical protein [Paludibacter jiangxiensis]GAT63281.1 hypothetical protein PJIAN_3598 [Paludibacter jiangxiensis]